MEVDGGEQEEEIEGAGAVVLHEDKKYYPEAEEVELPSSALPPLFPFFFPSFFSLFPFSASSTLLPLPHPSLFFVLSLLLPSPLSFTLSHLPACPCLELSSDPNELNQAADAC